MKTLAFTAYFMSNFSTPRPSFAEVLRAQTIQKWVEVRQTNPFKSQVQRTWRDLGDERSYAELPGPQGRSL